MNTKMIESFLQSAQLIFNQVINIPTDHGEISNDLFSSSILIKVSITGQVEGHLVLGMEEKIAIDIVERMMGGMKVTEIGDLEKSAISELGNMIGGNASMLLYDEGIRVDITPPQILERCVDPSVEAIRVPLLLGGIGEIHLMFSLKEVKKITS